MTVRSTNPLHHDQIIRSRTASHSVLDCHSRIVEVVEQGHSSIVMKARTLAASILCVSLLACAGEPKQPSTTTVRIAAAQAARRTIDFHLKPAQALAAVEKNFTELE